MEGDGTLFCNMTIIMVKVMRIVTVSKAFSLDMVKT